MAYGLGALTEGLQSGIKTRDELDLNKQYKRLLSDKADRADWQWGADQEAVRQQYMDEHGGSDEGFVPAQRSQFQDPALIRFGKWLNTRIRGFGQTQGPGLQDSGATTYALPDQYADGGSVEERRKRSYGKYYVTEDEAEQRRNRRQTDPNAYYDRPGVGERPGVQMQALADDTSGGGFLEGLSDVGRAISGQFDDTRRMALAGDEDVYESFDRLRNARSPREAGSAFTDWGIDSARAAGATTVGFLKDAIADNPVFKGVGGFVAGAIGMDGEDEQPQTGVPERPTPEAARAPQQAATDATTPAPEASNEDVAARAMEEGQQLALENLDYKLLVDQGVSPEELPSMTTRDWSDYRSAIFEREIARGASVKEAYQSVDYATVDAQMRGFQREGQKALLYLQSGQNREAAMALRQAYQYFPNGVSVKFGMATDPKTGQPAIVAIGTDEETGEPTGKPMLITGERLNAMMENMSNPSAFRAWTKDGRDLQMQINQLQSLDDYRQGSLEVARAGAITDRMRAESAGSAAGGMDYSDVDRRSDDYRSWAKEAELTGDYEQGVAIALADAMDRVTRVRPDVPPNTVIKAVEDAWRQGGEEGVIELLRSLQARE